MEDTANTNQAPNFEAIAAVVLYSHCYYLSESDHYDALVNRVLTRGYIESTGKTRTLREIWDQANQATKEIILGDAVIIHPAVWDLMNGRYAVHREVFGPVGEVRLDLRGSELRVNGEIVSDDLLRAVGFYCHDWNADEWDPLDFVNAWTRRGCSFSEDHGFRAGCVSCSASDLRAALDWVWEHLPDA